MDDRLKGLSVRRMAAVVAVALTAVALLAGCAAPVSLASTDAETVRTVSTGYVPSAAAAAYSSGSCGGVCYGYEPQADEPQAAQPTLGLYAGGGCVVGRADNSQSTCVCCGICDSSACETGQCDSACVNEGGCVNGNCVNGGCLADRLAAGSLCGAGAAAQRGCVRGSLS